MRAKWIKRKGLKKLIMFFAGFACDERLLSRSYIPEDCDLIMFFDYRGFDFDADVSGYDSIGVAAWSFGVWVADMLRDKFPRPALRMAINGSPYPVHDSLGIPPEIFQKTLEAFDERGKDKFFKRACGGASASDELGGLLCARGAAALKDELESLGRAFETRKFSPGEWDCAFASRADKIFPVENLKRAWGSILSVCEGDHLNPPLFGSGFSQLSQNVRKVKSAFEKSIASYEENAFVQREISETLSEALSRFTSEDWSAGVRNILEVGCGTGFLTRVLVPRFSAPKWHLNDLSERMCDFASKLCANKPDICAGDIMRCEFDEPIDLIVSSSCFQWIPNLSALFKKLCADSAAGAIMAFSTFGRENFSQIRALTGNSLNYESAEAISAKLCGAGYSVLYSAEDIVDVSFGSAVEVLRHIKSTGVNGKFSAFWTPAKAREFSKKYEDKFSDSDGVRLTYNPIYFVAQKSL